MPLDISVAICTYNRFEYLPKALLSLQHQSLAENRFEILIIDNSSDLEASNNFWDNYELPTNGRLVTGCPPGLSKARNKALELAKSPLIAFLDDDAIADEQWLESYVRYFSQNDDVVVAGGPITPIWPDDQPDWLPPTYLGCLTIINYGENNKELSENEYCYGANIVFRCDELKDVGGFNEQVGRIGQSSLLSNEEILVQNELSLNEAHSRGYCAKAIVAHHVDPIRLHRNWFRSRMAWQAVSEIIPGEKGGFSPEWNLEQLKASSKILGYDEFLSSLFSNSADSMSFDTQLNFIRHLVGQLLYANQQDDGLTQFLETTKDSREVSNKRSKSSTFDGSNQGGISLYKPSGLGSNKPHVFAEYLPGHVYLFEAYGLSSRTFLQHLPGNPWEMPMRRSLEELRRTLNQDNKTLTFITLDPFLYQSQKRIFKNFLKKIKLSVFGFIHRLPDSPKELENFREVCEMMTGIFALSEPFAEILTKELNVNNVRYVPHHPTKFQFTKHNEFNLRDELNIGPNQLVIGLMGELRKNKGLETLLTSLQFLDDRTRSSLHFLIAGKSTDYEVNAIKDAFSSSGCEYSIFSGSTTESNNYKYVNSSLFSKLMATTDVGLLLYDGVQKHLTSGIISDYIWLDKTVIATAGSITGYDVTKNKLGYLVTSNEPEELAELFNTLNSGLLHLHKGKEYQVFKEKIHPQNVSDTITAILDNYL